MLEPFYGLPVDEIVPATVKFCYLQGGEDHVAVKKFYHCWMRELMIECRSLYHPDVKLAYRFEWSFTTAGQATWDLPFRAPGVTDVQEMDPEQVVALFHAHCVAHFPGMGHSEGGQFFRMVFDGPSQVHVATPKYDQILLPNDGGQSAIRIEEQIRIANESMSLLHHPDDIDLHYDDTFGQGNITDRHSIDARLDDLALRLGMADYDCGEVLEDTDVERSSGLVNYIDYLHKEHLPKATTRYDKQSKNPTSEHNECRCASDLTASSSMPANDSFVRLSPAQMVIACHADAELKRAFHGKRLTHSFGTMNRTKCRSNTAASPRANSTNSVAVTPVAPWRVDVWANNIWFGDRFIGANGEASIGTTGPSTMDFSLSLQGPVQSSIIRPYYKEVASTTTEHPLFHWGKAITNSKLSLGTRILQPP
ncbi:hypothetical protein [uncultured Tateyamaria sp.]|uniref:hypothetical protein n=1 Tax=uncultured Tateyamaria sp. TaxID=455651 RepID=UPI002602F5AF|nr:hypothetical protein [uncultured Tateyamaria sp.]